MTVEVLDHDAVGECCYGFSLINMHLAVHTTYACCRGEPRDGRSYRESDRRSDEPRTRESLPAKKSSDVAKQPVAAPVAEVPRERPALKAGPAGGAYIPPFKLAQVC